MDTDTLHEVMAFARDLDHFLLATVAPDGQPHIAAAGELALSANGLLAITDWFCLTTLDNLRKNPKIAIIVWDRKRDRGYQLLGEAQGVEDLAMMDGYVPGPDACSSRPQVERRLLVRIGRILDFSQREQSDTEQ